MKRPTNFDADVDAISHAFDYGVYFTTYSAAEVLLRRGLIPTKTYAAANGRASAAIRHYRSIQEDSPEIPRIERYRKPGQRSRGGYRFVEQTP